MKRVVGCGFVGLALVALFLGALAWAVWTHGRLARAEREVDRAWTEIEILCRQRAEIVPRLVDSLRTGNGVDPALLDRLLEARDRSFEVLPTPWLVTDRERFERFRALQRRLSAAIDAVREAAAASPGGSGANEAASRLEAISAALGSASAAFDEASAAYNRLLTTPPSSWIARIGGFREAVELDDGP